MNSLSLIPVLGVLLVCAPALAQAGEPLGVVPENQPAPFAEGQKVPVTQALESVQWAGPAITLDALRGKTVIVLVYATWCPKCNAWSGELFAQLKEAVKDKPVVVLAVDADKSPAGVEQYLIQRGFFAPNIFHGYDPMIPTRLGFEGNLYHYVLIGPDGSAADKGSAGGYYETPQGRQFALPTDLAGRSDLGAFDFITPEMSEEVKLLFWPWELGSGSETALRAAQRKLGPEQREQVDAAVNRYLDAQIERIRGLYKGTVEERFEAYDTATALSGTFRTTPQSEKAKQVVAYMEKDEQFKRELAAKKVYEGAMLRAGGQASRGARVLRGLAKRYPDTHYGKLAEAALASTGPQ